MPFTFKLELRDGTPADPRTYATTIPYWRPGETLIVTSNRRYIVLDTREDPTCNGVLVVEPTV